MHIIKLTIEIEREYPRERAKKKGCFTAFFFCVEKHMGKFGQQDTKKTQRNKIIKKGIKMARTGTNESHMQQHKKKV